MKARMWFNYQAISLKVGYSDGLYGRSKGGKTFSGWTCEHLPCLVELDNFGASRHQGHPRWSQRKALRLGL